MRWRRMTGVLCLAALLVRPDRARALQFEQVPLSATEVIIGARGPVVPGDKARLDQVLAAVPPNQKVVALAVDSPGGTVDEAKAMVGVIRARALPVVIPKNSKCASACFLLLVASPRRLAAVDALIGVHSASEDGTETDIAWVVTRQMGRDAAELGIPPAIIGKMVQTTPGRVEWLTPDDLRLMNVTVYTTDLGAALRPAGPAGAAPNVRPAVPAGPSPAFLAGRDDRKAWDAWAARQTGAYRDGVVFAQGQATQAQPASCLGPGGASRGDFTQGCTVAQQKLAPVLARLQTSPDYAAGWSSAGQPVAISPPIAEPAEMTYRGAYFCGTQVARLILTVYPQRDQPRRRAMVTFGPEPTSPTVPRGAFMTEGGLDPRGGAMELVPTSWLEQPRDYAWVGLSGQSADGGKTFSGRVTGNPACSRFTLQRTDGVAALR